VVVWLAALLLGATIQGSYLAGGDTENNQIMWRPEKL